MVRRLPLESVGRGSKLAPHYHDPYSGPVIASDPGTTFGSFPLHKGVRQGSPQYPSCSPSRLRAHVALSRVWTQFQEAPTGSGTTLRPSPPPPQCGSLGFYVPISHQDPSGLLASEVVRFSGLMNSTVNAAAPIWGSLFSSPSSLYPPPLSSCSDSLLVILRSYPQLGARGNHVVLC